MQPGISAIGLVPAAIRCFERLQEILPRIATVEWEMLELGPEALSSGASENSTGALESNISYRLARATERLKWLLARPPKPPSFRDDLAAALAGLALTPMSRLVGVDIRKVRVDVVETYVDSTSETYTAGVHGVSQQVIPSWVDLSIEQLERKTSLLPYDLSHLRYHSRIGGACDQRWW